MVVVCCSVSVCSRTRAHLGVTVPAGDGDDPGEQVEVTAAGLVEHVLHPAFDDHQRLAVEREDRRVGVLSPGGEHLLAAGTGIRLRGLVEGRDLRGSCDYVGHGLCPGFGLRRRISLYREHPGYAV
jgi:hypothetical protein